MRHLFPDMGTNTCQAQLSFLVSLGSQACSASCMACGVPANPLFKSLGPPTPGPVLSAWHHLGCWPFFPSPTLPFILWFFRPLPQHTLPHPPTHPLPPLLHPAELAQNPHYYSSNAPSVLLNSFSLLCLAPFCKTVQLSKQGWSGWHLELGCSVSASTHGTFTRLFPSQPLRCPCPLAG